MCGRVRYDPVCSAASPRPARSATALPPTASGPSCAAAIGLTVHETERLSPHDLRAGFITEAYLNGPLDEQVAHHARQSDLNTTRGYRRRAKTIAASRR